MHAVGRLDQATSGLLLLTNDSALSSFLTDPANKVMRTYLVTVRGEFTEAQATEAVAGVVDGGERLQCHTVKIQKSSGRESHLEVVLIQGKNREIRRLFKALGHEVTRLRRIQYGPFKLEDLPSGAWREIPIEDVRKSLRLSTDSFAGLSGFSHVSRFTRPGPWPFSYEREGQGQATTQCFPYHPEF